MRKPIIAITPNFKPDLNQDFKPQESLCCVKETYLNCIGLAGALPVILSCTEHSFSGKSDFEQLAQCFDGFLFSGGTDLHPGLFGEEVLECCGEIIPERDNFELPLMLEAIRANKPVLGVCRGMQLLNVALGGTLYQDIPTQIKPSVKIHHQQPEPYTKAVHKVNIIKGTPLDDLVHMEQLNVNSVHHQAIKALAPSLRSMAVAGDGIIEAVYRMDKNFVMGVQWHPEFLGMEDAPSEKIFSAFVDACVDTYR